MTTISKHESLRGFAHDLVLDIYFITSCKKEPVKVIDNDRLQVLKNLIEDLKGCVNNKIWKDNRHAKSIDFLEDLAGKLMLSNWPESIDFDKDIKPWYNIQHDLQRCQEPIIHY